ncbi:thioester-containing protein 1 allele S1-like isoform X3 [Paramacrobiotus metropolitanus]|uniref:thioester-containing protein 1 allele S1-like isoform X3 n=1 Tax=Paramacrobiotus metropolitanus TaxID=2943436 RepID=UPI002445AFDF|nr:thioester-containing protein 1 allele S1-like isoform X3 [Paramacrobiotus metropolitanus]
MSFKLSFCFMLLLITVLQASYYVEETDDGSIVVYSHRRIRPNSVYEIIAHSLQKKFHADISVVIAVPGASGSVQSANITLEKGERRILRLQIPNVPATGSVKLTVTVVYQTANGPITKYSENLLELTSNKDANHIILIQLNKPIYKATDAIGFRALILDQDLKLSSSVKTITAILKDAYGESVETKANVSTAFPGSSGYFEGTFHPLPFEPDFGNWSVEIVAQDIKTSKTLQVADYRLPRFGIDFSAPDRLTMNIPALTFTAFVRDQNGNPVIGSLEIAILDPSNSTTRALPLQIEQRSYTIRQFDRGFRLLEQTS